QGKRPDYRPTRGTARPDEPATVRADGLAGNRHTTWITVKEGSTMKSAPKGVRLHIGIFGRRNVGNSSLLNALTRQNVSIVSDVPGTTTDPVEKPMEILPIGPVLFIDTAGIDDVGALGALRVQKARQVLDRTDIGIVVAVSGQWGEFEDAIVKELSDRRVPTV